MPSFDIPASQKRNWKVASSLHRLKTAGSSCPQVLQKRYTALIAAQKMTQVQSSAWNVERNYKYKNMIGEVHYGKSVWKVSVLRRGDPGQR